jgi:hypothetical protein
LALLPHIYANLPQLTAELAAYHTASVAYLAVQAHPVGHIVTANELWEFWRVHCLLLPNWFKGGKEVSSACVKRIFSLYTTLFDDFQRRTLEDCKEFSVMIHFNEGQRRLGR